MKRNEWTFEWTAGVLADAALAKKVHHASRLKWWSEQKDKVMAAIKERGIDVQESLAAMSYQSSSLASPQVRVDAGLARDLSEAHTKIGEHDAKVREYEGWRQVLLANEEARLPLTAADYLFFFGR